MFNERLFKSEVDKTTFDVKTLEDALSNYKALTNSYLSECLQKLIFDRGLLSNHDEGEIDDLISDIAQDLTHSNINNVPSLYTLAMHPKMIIRKLTDNNSKEIANLINKELQAYLNDVHYWLSKKASDYSVNINSKKLLKNLE